MTDRRRKTERERGVRNTDKNRFSQSGDTCSLLAPFSLKTKIVKSRYKEIHRQIKIGHFKYLNKYTLRCLDLWKRVTILALPK